MLPVGQHVVCGRCRQVSGRSREGWATIWQGSTSRGRSPNAATVTSVTGASWQHGATGSDSHEAGRGLGGAAGHAGHGRGARGLPEHSRGPRGARPSVAGQGGHRPEWAVQRSPGRAQPGLHRSGRPERPDRATGGRQRRGPARDRRGAAAFRGGDQLPGPGRRRGLCPRFGGARRPGRRARRRRRQPGTLRPRQRRRRRSGLLALHHAGRRPPRRQRPGGAGR
jgi:hypothetical protein